MPTTRSRSFDPSTLSKRERQYHHVLEGYLSKGVPYPTAVARAAAFANKQRSKAAKAGGPKLVGKGGSRRAWYPGKAKAKDVFACLKHGRKFKSKSGLLAHFRGGEHVGGGKAGNKRTRAALKKTNFTLSAARRYLKDHGVSALGKREAAKLSAALDRLAASKPRATSVRKIDKSGKVTKYKLSKAESRELSKLITLLDKHGEKF